MAGIPISQIPNAPDVKPAPQDQPVATSILSGPTKNLLTPHAGFVASNAPAASGRDLSHLGDRAPAVGAVLDHYAQLRTAANDYSALNQAAGLYRDGAAQLLQSTAGQPEEDAQAKVQDFATTMQQQTAALPLSPSGQTRLAALHQTAVSQAAQAVTQQATGEFIERTRAAALDQYNQLMDSGAYEAAHGVLHQGASLGLFRPGETDAIAQAGQRAVQLKQAQSFMQAQPFDAQSEMNEAHAQGKSEAFPWMTSEDIARFHGQAQQAAAQTQQQVSDGIDQAVFSGQLTDPTTVRQMAARGRLPEAEIASHLASLAGGAQPTTPEERGQALQTQSELKTALEHYDPALDASGAGYYGLKSTIRQNLPANQRASSLKALQQRQQSGRDPSSLIKGDAFSQIDVLANRVAQTKNTSARAAVWQKASQWKQKVSDYMQRNPDATSNEVHRILSDLTNNDIVTQQVLNRH